MASRQLTLSVELGKKDIASADSGSASGNVIVQFDNAENKANIVAALEKIKQQIIEKEY